LEAYVDLTGIKVVAITDSDPIKVAEASREFQLPGFSAVEEMLDSTELDIACIVTPPAKHEEAVLRCAASGVHSLCEKPLALSLDACRRMIASCRENDVRLGYGASYRYLPALVVAREMIQRGDLGEILLLRESAVGGNGSGKRGTLPFTHYPKGGPGGAGMGLCDHGIHLIDAFSWLIDSSVTRVSGRGNISGELQRPEFAHLEYANGAIGELLYEDGTYSTDLPQEGIFACSSGWSVGVKRKGKSRAGAWDPHPGCIHVHGTRGSLRVFYYASGLFLRDDDGVREVRVEGRAVPANFSRQLEAFAEAIRTGAPTPVPGEVGLAACRTLLDIYASQGAVLPTSEAALASCKTET
jgi:predicted dehydrogenase